MVLPRLLVSAPRFPNPRQRSLHVLHRRRPNESELGGGHVSCRAGTVPKAKAMTTRPRRRITSLYLSSSDA